MGWVYLLLLLLLLLFSGPRLLDRILKMLLFHFPPFPKKTKPLQGQETSAIAISWTLALLAERPDVVMALREEIQACIGNADNSFDQAAVDSLLSACLAGDLK